MANLSSNVFLTSKMPTWCPGCGDFGIWMSLKDALSKLGIGSDDGVCVYGVGCHGNMTSWMKIYGFAGLHGRTLPVAQGIKLANHKLPVICISGDGDGLGEGGNHFLHAAKRNPDLTVILHDNQVYGLTTGQASPTAKQGLVTKSTPDGVTDSPINPLAFAITAGATFVARGFAGDTQNLTKIMMAAIEHKGFSLVDVLQPCVTFNKVNTYQWYRERVYYLEENYDASNKIGAFEKSQEWGDKIPLGIFYKENRPTAEELESAIKEEVLVHKPNEPKDFDGLLTEFI
jgi:2-oxoglutarate/2-oxoacid ferredoxin oxidoreductase subunit beta